MSINDAFCHLCIFCLTGGIEEISNLWIIKGKYGEIPTAAYHGHSRERSDKEERVLVVDDSADLLSLSKTVLEIDDYEVFTALSGKDALVVLAEIAQPDLILLDMRMEDMSGPEIFKNVPVVFITAMDKILASKAVGFIRKPFDMDTFLAAVHRFIEIGTNRIRSN